MRKLLLILALTAGMVLLQTTVLAPHIAPAFRPDIFLVAVVFIGLYGSVKFGAPAAYLAGLLKDVFGGLYFGLHGFSFLMIFMLIRSVAHRLYAESTLLHVLAVMVSCLVSALLNFLLLLLFSEARGIYLSISSDLLPHILSTAFCASLVSLLPVRRSVLLK